MILKFKFSSNEDAETCAQSFALSQTMCYGVYVRDTDLLLIMPPKHNLPGAASIFMNEIRKTMLINNLVKPDIADRSLADEYGNIAMAHLKFSEMIVNQKPELN